MELTKSTSNAIHPYGVFWLMKQKVIQISRENIYQIAAKEGFCLYKGEIHRVIGIIINKSSEREFQDVLRAYIQENGEFDHIEVCNAYEAFMQKSCSYTISRLSIIQPQDLLHDSRQVCYKFFTNGVVEITADGIEYKGYDNISKLVLGSKIQPREYAQQSAGLYLDFLAKATNWNSQQDYIQRIIGYLAHDYKDETTGYIIVLTEECPDPKDGGGSGKNVFCNLLSKTTTYLSTNGHQAKFDEKFFQSWTGQRVMGISDLPKNFPFSFLKEPSTGGFKHKLLYKNEIEVSVEDGPKFILQTNYSYEITDGGLRRRIIPIEFTDFFTRAGGIDVHYGIHFPSGWSKEDWNCYDTIIIKSVHKWLKNGLKLHSAVLSETGYEKQFELTYGKDLTEFIRDNFESWTNQGQVFSEDIRIAIKTFFNENDVPLQFRPGKNRIASAIKEFAKHSGISLKANHSTKDLFGIVKKAYFFSRE